MGITRDTVHLTVQEAPPRTAPNVVPEETHQVSANTIVVAAKALHTPALRHRSQDGRDRTNPNVSRFLTLHPTYNVNAIHPEEITNYCGFPKTWYVDAFSEREGYYPETSFYDPGVTAKNLPGFGVQHRRFMRRYNQMTSILLLADDPPWADNRIATDRSGDPVIDYTVLDPVRPALAKGHPPQRPVTTVVAPDGRLHGLDSVYVADASLFPTSVKADPYETVMLLATHVAETVAERCSA